MINIIILNFIYRLFIDIAEENFSLMGPNFEIRYIL